MNSGLFAVATAVLLAKTAEGRTNSTGAVNVFLITDCKECTKDGDSIFCTEGKGGDTNNYVEAWNNSLFPPVKIRYDLSDKKRMFGAADGSKYCWSGQLPARQPNGLDGFRSSDSPPATANNRAAHAKNDAAPFT